MKFTLPLANGNSPFQLTEEDKMRSSDNWAWSFLRLNPYYRHDFNLIKVRPKVQAHLDEAKLLISHFRMKKLPAEYSSIRHTSSLTSLPTELPKTVADLDSRYFMLDGEPLSLQRKQFNFEPETLQRWLTKHGGITGIAQLDVRDIDAPRDYGIATWIDPNIQALEQLPPGESWFHFINEPVWGAGTWALRPSNLQHTHVTAHGHEIIVGIAPHPVVVERITESFGLDAETVKQLVPGYPVPPKFGSRRSTELYFLICLDGYIEPQLDAVRPIADKLKALHRQYFPKAVAKGSLPDFVPIIENPHDPTTQLNGTLKGLFNSLSRAPSRYRSNWRAITIDVAAPMVIQFKILEKRLTEIQKSLTGQLSFPLRKRTRGVDGDHWLKKDLCVLELHCFGFGDKNIHPSVLAMTRAFFDNSDPMYLLIRNGMAIQKSHYPAKRITSDSAEHPEIKVVVKALENAKTLSLGWYEFVAWLGADTKTKKPSPPRHKADLA